MAKRRAGVNRRGFLAAGAGLAAAAGVVGRVEAAEMTAAERANVRLVNDFCAAWPSHDLASVMSFFADAGAYRMTETMEPAKGRDAVTLRVKSRSEERRVGKECRL